MTFSRDTCTLVVLTLHLAFLNKHFHILRYWQSIALSIVSVREVLSLPYSVLLQLVSRSVHAGWYFFRPRPRINLCVITDMFTSNTGDFSHLCMLYPRGSHRRFHLYRSTEAHTRSVWWHSEAVVSELPVLSVALSETAEVVLWTTDCMQWDLEVHAK